MKRNTAENVVEPIGHERRKHSHRLPYTAIGVLENWIQVHRDHPYPTKSEKAGLQRSTGLSVRQIELWFVNARRRRKHVATMDVKVLDSQCAPDPGRLGGDIGIHDCYEASISVPSDLTVPKPSTQPQRWKIFQCTFCTDSFASKHDWTRHETSLHLSLRRFICCPFSPILTKSGSMDRQCGYCGQKDPSTDHIEAHNHSACQARPPDARMFSRKDHLRQHLRSVHECDFLPHMNTWVLEAEYVNSRCGFCGQNFTTWTTRNDHIAAHYKEGLSMDLWRGCRGLDSVVSAQVNTAMPPFLIGIERNRLRPFSASLKRRESCHNGTSNGISRDCDSVSNWRWDATVIELQNLVMHYSAQGFTISDEAMRQHARFFVKDLATPTAADHPEWLDTFKRAYCLDILPIRRDMTKAYITDDLEVYHDLGLTMPKASYQQEKALHVLFSNNGPVRNTDTRFSSIQVSAHQALPFETISGPWPKAGILGQLIIVRDLVFSSTIWKHINYPFTTRQEYTQMGWVAPFHLTDP